MTLFTRFVRTFVFVFLALAVPALASAQEIGIKGGLNFSTLNLKDGISLIDFERREGIVGGLFVALPVGKVAIQAEGLVSVRGAKGSDLLDADFEFTYLEVPVLLRFTPFQGSGRLHLYTGPSFGIKLKDSLEVEGEPIEDANVKDTDFGWAVGAALEFRRFIVDGRFVEGLRSINGDADADIRNRTVSVMVGIRLK